ncbi:MAG: polysaccharide deacetylase family protein [Saccharofermentanales bacterium]
MVKIRSPGWNRYNRKNGPAVLGKIVRMAVAVATVAFFLTTFFFTSPYGILDPGIVTPESELAPLSSPSSENPSPVSSSENPSSVSSAEVPASALSMEHLSSEMPLSQSMSSAPSQGESPSVSTVPDLSWIPEEGLSAPDGWTGPIVYLTFDDGPSTSRTVPILSILDAYGIKGTFFIIGKNITGANIGTLKQAAEAGHTIGNHTWSHFSSYKSLDIFKQSVDRTSALIEEITGVRPFVFRYPGGSIEISSDAFFRQTADYLELQGLDFCDWNTTCGNGNENAGYSAEQMKDSIMKYVRGQKTLVVLMHDTMTYDSSRSNDLVGALPLVIKALYDRGYVFSEIKPQSPLIHFRAS